MKKIVVVVPHSHTWFWSQTCVSMLIRNPPRVDGYEVQVVVVDNSPWSPAVRGVRLLAHLFPHDGRPPHFVENHKSNKFHASALDCVVEKFDFDYLMALETDVLALRPTWLQWFVDMMRPTDYAVGMWHHERFVNPSCTLYRGVALREMQNWCLMNREPDVLRWGPSFSKSQDIAARAPERDYRGWYDDNVSWIAGPFAEKRGWPEGTILNETPSGQEKGPGWYEPGQQLHHWAVQRGYTYTVCPTMTTKVFDLPVQTMYGAWGDVEHKAEYPPSCRMGCGDRMHNPMRQLEPLGMVGTAMTAHLWGGTRALDIIKHDVTCQFVKKHTPGWLAREARFWKALVSPDVQAQTLDLIRKYGFHYTGQGTDHVSDRDRAAAEYAKQCYNAGGVDW